jgi:hypothetical protein
VKNEGGNLGLMLLLYLPFPLLTLFHSDLAVRLCPIHYQQLINPYNFYAFYKMILLHSIIDLIA